MNDIYIYADTYTATELFIVRALWVLHWYMVATMLTYLRYVVRHDS